MGKTLNEQERTISVAQVKHHGEQLILPEQMSVAEAMDLLQRWQVYNEEEVEVHDTFDAFPWDGAAALAAVLTRKFGWAPAEAQRQQGLFGETKHPPKSISVATGYNEHMQVPWGAFNLPNISGHVCTGVRRDGHRIKFALEAEVLRKDEETVRQLFDEVREELRTNSIYQGKAIKLRFRDEDGDLVPIPDPQFIDTSIDESMLVYSKGVEAAIETNLFTPISRVPDCALNNIPVKRGVLLGGTYGTGKTLAAKVAAKRAEEAGVTYLYVPRADELAQAVEFAKQYGDPACVVFCEDVDRVMSGERNVQMDDLLNIIDGIDTKNSNIVVVLTTNRLDTINPAMLRPGRLDAVIEVTPPDAEAVQRLLRVYGEGAIADDTDLSRVGTVLEGTIPAVIEEVVKRAKLAELRRQPVGTKVESISEEALLEAAQTMQHQMALLDDKHEEEEPSLDDHFVNLVRRANNGSMEKIEDLHKRIM